MEIDASTNTTSTVPEPEPSIEEPAPTPAPKRASTRIRKQQEAAAATEEQQEQDENEEGKGNGKGKGKGKRGAGAKATTPSKGKKAKGTGGSSAGAPPLKLKGLAALPQVNWLLFKSEVLPLLKPKDLVRLSGVCRRYRAFASSDDVWEPLLAKFSNGDLLRELEKGNCLSNPYNQPAPKGAKAAYLAASTGKCKGCGAWSPLFNILTLEMACWPCFDSWRKSGQLMGKSKAMEQYLLSDKEAKALPHVTSGDPSVGFGSSTVLCRKHVEELIAQKYEDGMEGLEADRAERKEKAEKNRANVMAKWQERVKKAQAEGKRAPKRPKEPKVLHSKIDVNDYGCMVGWDPVALSALNWAGFVKKEDPSKPRNSDCMSTSECFTCPHCKRANPNLDLWKRQLYPSHWTLIGGHINECPHAPDDF